VIPLLLALLLQGTITLRTAKGRRHRQTGPFLSDVGGRTEDPGPRPTGRPRTADVDNGIGPACARVQAAISGSGDVPGEEVEDHPDLTHDLVDVVRDVPGLVLVELDLAAGPADGVDPGHRLVEGAP
jgi:hypothetical protein